MESDQKIQLQYSAKAAGIANFWKKMIGESRGIKRLDAIAKKQAFEHDFEQWAQSNPETKAKYSPLLPAFSTAVGLLTGSYSLGWHKMPPAVMALHDHMYTSFVGSCGHCIQ